jgi:hypothetical protein
VSFKGRNDITLRRDRVHDAHNQNRDDDDDDDVVITITKDAKIK